MWHDAAVVQIFREVFHHYGYEVLQDRKKCVALCGDLLASYDEEKSVMQMLFLAGLGEAFGNVPYKTEHELKTGIYNVGKFLDKHAIDQSVKDNVINIVTLTMVGESIDVSGVNLNKKELIKSFAETPFKLQIPTVYSFADRVQFSFKYIYREKDSEIDVVFDKCVITDKLKVVHTSKGQQILFQHGKTKNINIDVTFDGRKIFLSDAEVKFEFQCSNQKKIVVFYSVNHSHKLTFEKIEVSQLKENQYTELIKIIEESDAIAHMSPLIDELEYYDGTAAGDNASEEETSVFVSPNISEYSDALHKEIFFLKLGRGKKHKIVNGTKINQDRGIYTYLFELENELHLPDDAPVVVEVAGMQASGSVMLCEDFQILLLLDRNLNEHVNTAYLMVEPWKLLEALDKKMCSLISGTNRLAIQLMEKGPELATAEAISKVPMGYDNVLSHFENNEITAVWGPPGTGKTYLMAKIAIDYVKKGKSVLIVSHSNVSVDGVIKRIVSMLDGSMQQYLKDGKILRYGYVRDDELSKHPFATSFNYALGKCPSYATELDEKYEKRQELIAKHQMKTPEYDALEKQIKKLREVISKEERRYAESSQLIATTISKATVHPMFEDRQYDLVMFDEVSMAYVPQVIVAASMAREKFMCVGDFKQLSPISQSPDAKNVLSTDIYSYMHIVDGKGEMHYHPWLTMLNCQRRMHPDISAFPNTYIYRKLLENHPDTLHKHKVTIFKDPLPGDALNLINLACTYCAEDKNSDNSRFNILSAVVSFSTAVQAEKSGINKVGIITPYAAQARLIRAMIRDYYPQGTNAVNCATVHQFQGSESDVIIFDSVESYPGGKVGFLMGKDEQEVTRLINVAITRSRGKFITVANAKFWENAFKDKGHIYKKLLKYIQDKHTVIRQENKTLQLYMESINPEKTVSIYVDETLAIDVFEVDMKKAKQKVFISIPDGELCETQGRVMDIVDETESRGIDILMKSNDYTNLHEDWKLYCWGTVNAVFPLILIDDETIWYGLPTSKLKFKVDKTTTLHTVLQVMVRITGKNTIEMIKAFTELEMIDTEVSKKPLKVKYKSDFDPMKDKSVSLPIYVEEKKFCPECKNHMVMAKSKKGATYIKCSSKSCKHQEYLDKEFVNFYIKNSDISCPKQDGGKLKCGLGKYGLYIRCSEGHFLDPTEI
jgi:hypothetical protein